MTFFNGTFFCIICNSSCHICRFIWSLKGMGRLNRAEWIMSSKQAYDCGNLPIKIFLALVIRRNMFFPPTYMVTFLRYNVETSCTKIISFVLWILFHKFIYSLATTQPPTTTKPPTTTVCHGFVCNDGECLTQRYFFVIFNGDLVSFF